MANIIPKRSTWLVVAAELVIIALVSLFFRSTLAHLLPNPLFSIPVGVFLGGLIYADIHWIVTLWRPAYEFYSHRMWLTVVFAIAAILYIGCWSAQYKADKSDNIEYNYKQ